MCACSQSIWNRQSNVCRCESDVFVCVQVWWWGKHGLRFPDSRWRSCLVWKITGASVSPGAPQEPPRAARCTSASHVSINTLTHRLFFTGRVFAQSAVTAGDSQTLWLHVYWHTHIRSVRESVSWLKVMEHLCRSETADRRQSGAHKHTHTHTGDCLDISLWSY